MQKEMFCLTHEHQVFGTIILLIPVDVMNVFIAG